MCQEGAEQTVAPSGPCCGNCKPKRYNIVRLYRKRERKERTTHRGLSLANARAHCQRDDTHGPGWFDSYEEAN